MSHWGFSYVFDAHWYPIDINWCFIQKRLFNLLIEQDYFNKPYLARRNLFDCAFIRSVLLKSSNELIDSYYHQLDEFEEKNSDPDYRDFSTVFEIDEPNYIRDFWVQRGSLLNSLPKIQSNFEDGFLKILLIA